MRISVIGGGVQERAQLARLAVVEQHAALVGVEAAGGIAGRDDDLLQRPDGALAAAVGGHEAHQALRVRRARDEAERLVQLAACERAQHVVHRVDALVHRQQRPDVGIGEDEHAHAKRAVSCSRLGRREVEGERLEGGPEVLGPPRPDHDRGHARVGEEPGDRERGRRRPARARPLARTPRARRRPGPPAGARYGPGRSVMREPAAAPRRGGTCPSASRPRAGRTA